MKGLTHTIESRRPYFYTEVWAEYVGGEGADIENRITEIYELMTSRNYIILGVGDDMRLEKIMDFRGLMGRKEPNYIFVPGELLDKFESCIASLENCEVKSRLS